MAHGEAQRAADAAALAGAKMYASSGYTSAPTSLPAAEYEALYFRTHGGVAKGA